MQVLASQLRFLANRNAGQAIPPLFWPVSCIKIGGSVALLSDPTVNCLYCATSSNLEWSKSLQDLPTLTIKEIELFFEETGMTGKTIKRADNLLFENFLDSILCSHDTDHFYVKAICSALYTKNVYHQPSCCLSRTNAQVEYAYCTCKAGQGGFCNHAYALFKLVAQFVLDKLNEVPMQLPCTSRPCGWTVRNVRKMNVQKPTVMETVIKKAKLRKIDTGVQCNLYEARSLDQ